jgi:hypothetical protein
VIGLNLSVLQAQTKSIAGNDLSYYKVSVNFYSIGSGINLKAMDEVKTFLNAFQTSHENRLQYETIYWGKEGEQLIYFDLQQISAEDQITFTDSLWKLTHTMGSLVKMQINLFLNESRQQLCFSIVPFNLLIEQEQKVLDFISAFENETNNQLLGKPLVNDTHIPEDQNLHYLIELSRLTKKDQERFIEQMNALLKPSNLSAAGSR